MLDADEQLVSDTVVSNILDNDEVSQCSVHVGSFDNDSSMHTSIDKPANVGLMSYGSRSGYSDKGGNCRPGVSAKSNSSDIQEIDTRLFKANMHEQINGTFFYSAKYNFQQKYIQIHSALTMRLGAYIYS